MWHDGIDPTAASGLEGEEHFKAEEMLIESMEEGIYWAPMGLREMKSKKAIPRMKQLIESTYPLDGISKQGIDAQFNLEGLWNECTAVNNKNGA